MANKLLSQFLTGIFPPKPFDAETESLFLRDYSERIITQRRIAVVIAVCTSLYYFGIDIVDALNDEAFKEIATLKIFPSRLTGTIAMTLSAGFLFHPAAKINEHYVCFCIYCSSLSIYFMLLALTYQIPFPDDYLFCYDGMLLSLFFLFGFSRMLAKPTILLVIILLLASWYTFDDASNSLALSALIKNPFREHDESPMVFLSIFSIIGCFISVNQERVARQIFTNETQLKLAHEQTELKAAEVITLKEQSRVQAERQNQEKSRFIAAAAHDLRNVMQPVGNFLNASFIALSQGKTSETLEYLKQAIKADKAMCADVKDILDLSELESGIIKIKYTSFDVRVLAEEVIRQNDLDANNKQVSLRIATNKRSRAIVSSDRHHLKRILTNLLGNGVKYADYSKPESIVAIAIVSLDNSIRVDVIDNGKGIPLSEQENIFNAFFQLDNPERNRDKGQGLGLSIVKSTINLLEHHSIKKLRSKPGLGTRFTLLLPKGDELNVEEPVQLVNQERSLKGLYVLLVENDIAVNQSIIAILKENGAKYEAVSSVAALQSLLPTLERDPDVVITDHSLPDERTATDVITLVKSTFGYDPPLLIITGETVFLDKEFRNNRVLLKPIESEHLLVEINLLGRNLNEA